jgi:microcystin-dependent protein
MAEPFLAEIRLMSISFAPAGWALCNGQFLLINQNQALFSLLGTTYGGNGTTNFALPDLRGRTPIHLGGGHPLGERAGAQAHTLSIAEMPAHTHVLSASPLQGNSVFPRPLGGANLLASDPGNAYAPADAGTLAALAPGTVANVGGSQAHLNMQPFLTLTFCIAISGIFPSQN